MNSHYRHYEFKLVLVEPSFCGDRLGHWKVMGQILRDWVQQIFPKQVLDSHSLFTCHQLHYTSEELENWSVAFIGESIIG